MLGGEGFGLGLLLSLFGLNLFLSHVVVQAGIHGNFDGSSALVLAFLDVLFFALKFVLLLGLFLVFVSFDLSVDLLN